MKIKVALKSVVAGTFCMFAFSSPVKAEGNRYEFERFYHSEISASEAYRKMQRGRSILIDVRRLREHAAGHPRRSFNVPYPHIINNNDQSPETLYWEVYRIVKGKTHKNILTLCRTGARSVRAGNILANPAAYGIEGPAFTNVQNIWEGFVGRYKEPYIAPYDPESGQTPQEHEELDHKYLDLNNNGVLDEDVADVYEHSADSNPDKDGWRNYMALPWNTRISRRTAYLRDRSLYLPFIVGEEPEEEEEEEELEVEEPS